MSAGGGGGDRGPEHDDGTSFAELASAMGDIERLAAPTRAQTRPTRRPGEAPPRRDEASRGTGGGPPPVASARTRRRLSRGQLEPQATVDLHGLSRTAARTKLCNAIARLRGRGMSCVLVIHGKGHHSTGGRAILKSCLPTWLAEPPLSGQVIAHAPARPRDGGAGATYLLLR